MRHFALVFGLVAGVVGSAQAQPGKITSVKFRPSLDGLGFTLSSTQALNADAVELKLIRGNQILAAYIDGVQCKDQKLAANDESVSAVVIRPVKGSANNAEVQIRLRRPLSPAVLAAARIKIKGLHLRVDVPRTAKIAARWAKQNAKLAQEEAKKNKSAKDKRKRDELKKQQAAKDEAARRKKLAKRKDATPFIEGELASVGMIGLVPWENRFGLLLGIERLGEIFYGSISPTVNHTAEVWGDPISLSFGIPIRVQILDARADRRWDDAGRFRTEDWDEVSDYAQVIRSITYGGKEQHIYLDVSAFKASTVGHGTLVKRYNPHLNLNTHRVNAHLDAFGDYAGFESFANDITRPNVFGGLVFVKPLSVIDRSNFVMRSFSVGVSVAADVDAPVRNYLDVEDADLDGRRETEQAIDQEDFQPKFLSSEVVAYGVDIEAKMVDTDTLDWKTYLDWSFLETGVPSDRTTEVDEDRLRFEAVRSSGFTLGQLLRINTKTDPIQALRIRVEYRNYDPNYLPSYFDSLYEIQRVQYLRKSDPTALEMANGTKLIEVLGRDPDGDRVNGFYFETTWRLSHFLALAYGLEMNDQTPDDNMFVHLEIPHIGQWQFLAAYHRRTVSGFSELFDFDLSGNDLFILKTRYGVTDWFHWNFELLTPFRVGSKSQFENALQANLGIEIGVAY